MKLFISFIIILGFSLTQVVSAQNQNIRFHNIGTKDGLSHSTVNAIAEDKLGYIWFSTQDGLNRYDGYEFKVYHAGNTNKTLLKNWISNIFIDSYDQVWLYYLSGGISRFDPVKEIFHHYTADSKVGSISSTSYQTYSDILVNIFFEDSDKNLWIATNNGANKFNRLSNSFDVLQNKPSDANSISDNHITFITEDNERNIWFGTQNGLNLYNLDTKVINRFLSATINKQILSDTIITYIKTCPDSSIWVGTVHGGLNIIEHANSKNQIIHNVLQKPFRKFFDAAVFDIYRTKAGEMYVGSQNGLYRINKENGTYIPDQIYEWRGEKSNRYAEDENGFLWTASDIERTLCRINPTDKSINYFNSLKSDLYSFKGEKVQFLHISKTGVLWIGCEKGGVYKVDFYAKAFHLINDNPDKELHISNKEVYGIFEDENSNLYIGTKDGLNIINLKDNSIQLFKGTRDKINNITYSYSHSIPAIIIGVIKETKNHKIWLGAFDNKVSLYEPDTKIFLNFHHNENDANSFKTWSLRTICITKNNNTYFGGTGSGLSMLNADGLSFTHFPIVKTNNNSGTNDYRINSIIEDSEGLIWIGTLRGGLNIYNPKTNIFTHFVNNPSDLNTISSNHVSCILDPKIYNKGIMWIGTMGGLNKFDKKTQKFTNYTIKDGMPDNTATGILEDNSGMLWISTNKGLVKFDPITEKFTVYTQEDGLQGDEFNECSFFKNENGILYFGGTNGLTYFNPNEIKDNPYDANVVFTNFKLFNKTIEANDTINKHVILKNSISYTKELFLSHKEKVISFEFAALHFITPKKLTYRYKLENFEENWNDVNANQRFINYTNLPSGDYTLKVISNNSDGKWSDKPTEIIIHVLPPFWETTWFLLLMGGLLLIIFLSIIHYRTKSLEIQKRKLEKEVADRTKDLKGANKLLENNQEEILQQSEEIAAHRDSLSEQNIILEQQKEEMGHLANKLHESDQLKLHFFTNISHEFRTPLTLMMGPTEKLLKLNNYNNTSDIKQDLSLILRNEKRLFKLINQLLEIRKVETGNLKLKVFKEDIVSYLNSIFLLFVPLAEQKNIDFQFITKQKNIVLYYDADKIEKIFYNLLSNAFKHTPEGGSIQLVVSESRKHKNSNMLIISVTDSGSGISKEHISNIFDRFFQISNKNESGQISSGIGLSLSKDLVKAHYGKIQVKSEINKGTKFEVYLPLSKNTYKLDEIQSNPEHRKNIESSEAISIAAEHEDEFNSLNPTDDDGVFRILVVEDNADMRRFLFKELSRNYSIMLAQNGIEGLRIARDQLPDLIISDVMMPEMNGLDMCKEIKSNELTSHIPVFLLTAKSETEHQVAGFETGADDYIVKPFSIDVLQYRIKNIIEARNKLADMYSAHSNYIPENIKISPIDHGFLNKFVKYVEDNIDDTELTGDKIATELAMSKGNLYKKLKALNGMSVNIYIRTIRLKLAAKLLKKGEYSISDVAYVVGFNNPKYFSTCFSELFSISPKEYMNKQK